MPHIRIEASSGIFDLIDWTNVLNQLHMDLAGQAWAKLDDLKSRIHHCATSVSADDARAQQVVATLVLTNPRPAEMQQAMSQMVLNHLERAIDATRPDCWVQCCVFLQPVPKHDYLKRQWNPPCSA
jgi:5-carboxymethyl-2-hydroxymuconate isomerase